MPIVFLRCLRVALLSLAIAASFCPMARAEPVLTTAAQVRALSPEAAARALPVELTGVVTYSVRRLGYFTHTVVQDDTGGIYVGRIEPMPTFLEVGRRVTIRGVSSPGRFAPTVDAQTVEDRGRGTPPSPVLVTYEDLLTGRYDSQWVELQGVVHSARVLREPEFERLAVVLGTGGARLQARLQNFEPHAASRLVGSTVRMRGVCASIFNAHRQMVRPLLWVPDFQGIDVLNGPPPGMPPVVPIESLARFSPEESARKRVRIRGAVVARPNAATLYVQDGVRGIRVETAGAGALSVSDLVEISGFPALGDFGPLLLDATFQKLGRAVPVPPLPVRAEQATDHHGALVRLSGRVIARSIRPGAEQIHIDSLGTIFRAVLEHSESLPLLRDAVVGSSVEVTGICEAELGSEDAFLEQLRPASFWLRLRSGEDAIITQRGPWWTAERVHRLTLACLASSILAIGLLFLRGRLRAGQMRYERVAYEERLRAVLEERTRLAREVHDTLAQGLTAISVQLEVAKRDWKCRLGAANEHLDVARSLVRESLGEARRFAWAMRAQALEGTRLDEALQAIAHQLTAGTEITVECRVVGAAQMLPDVIETNLLRIGQEALTNAVRHAAPRHLEIVIEHSRSSVALKVCDDGRGFEARWNAEGRKGLGLQGMRERMALLGGVCLVESGQDSGTCIRATVPLAQPRTAA